MARISQATPQKEKPWQQLKASVDSRELIQMEDALQHWYIMYLGQFVSGRLGLAHQERSFP